MSEVKAGDRVWIQVAVQSVGKEIAWELDRYPRMSIGAQSEAELLIPDSPALPAVARWLAETTDAVDELLYVLNVHVVYHPHAHELKALVAALSATAAGEERGVRAQDATEGG